MFELSTEEKQKLKNIQADALAFLALKKFFVNEALRDSQATDINILGAERIALDIIRNVLEKLQTFQQDDYFEQQKENIV